MGLGVFYPPHTKQQLQLLSFYFSSRLFSNYEILGEWNDDYDDKRDANSFLSQKDQISHQSEADERKTEEKKLGSKVYELNKSPSSVHLELDASIIIAILTHTKDRIALNYICWTVHSRWTLEVRWPRVGDWGMEPPARPQQQDWVPGVLLGRLIGEFPLNKLHLICLGTKAEFAFWGLIFSTRSQGNEEAQRPQTEALDPLKNI